MNPEDDLAIKCYSWDWSAQDGKYVLDGEEDYVAGEWIRPDTFNSQVKFVVHLLSEDQPFAEEFYFYSQAKEFMDKHLSLGHCAVLKKVQEDGS